MYMCNVYLSESDVKIRDQIKEEEKGYLLSGSNQVGELTSLRPSPSPKSKAKSSPQPNSRACPYRLRVKEYYIPN